MTTITQYTSAAADYEGVHTLDVGDALIPNNVSATSASEYVVQTMSLSSPSSSISLTDHTTNKEDDYVLPSTVNGPYVISTEDTSLQATTSVVSSSATVSPSHDVSEAVFINAVLSTTARTSTMMISRGTNTQDDQSSDVTMVLTTNVDVNAAEQTVKVTTIVPPSIFPPSSPWFFVVIAAFVFFSVLIAFVVVCLTRARSQHKLCWTKHQCYLPVSSLHQNDAGVSAAVPKKLSAELAPLTSV